MASPAKGVCPAGQGECVWAACPGRITPQPDVSLTPPCSPSNQIDVSTDPDAEHIRPSANFPTTPSGCPDKPGEPAHLTTGTYRGRYLSSLGFSLDIQNRASLTQRDRTLLV